MKYDTKAILESLSTAILMTNSKLRIVYANNAAEQLFGMSLSKVLTLKITDIVEKNSNIYEAMVNALKPNFQGFSASDIQIYIDKNTKIHVDLNITTHAGNTKGLVIEIRSLNYQHILNDDLQSQLQQDATRALIRHLAHEIKNPLGGIRGAAQLLEMTYAKDNNVKDYTKVIIEQSDRLKNLVDSLLGPQKASGKKLCNIHYVIEKVISLGAMEVQGKVRFDKDYDPSLPDIEIDIDAMQQALLNVVGNAIQALIQNKIENPTIRVKTRASIGYLINGVQYPTSIAISITDNGPGIPENLIKTIFYPMFTTKSDGNGLGLCIAQGIVERHKGKIECQSTKGQTTFTITLPIVKNN